ncbi:MAG: TetR/AcrR family transcriptional regulator [Gammaproteobacteria bacterium]|nr:TetR/AcrR family transcriptional regulator [Gammaproteobacteria bacterium]
MKTTKKQQTHQRMLDAAGQSFRSKGYAGIGVDGIAKAAGVTSGAFYAHLGSKDKAFRAAVDAGLDEVISAIPKFQKEASENWVKAFSEYYLGKSHRDDLACGCAMTTLSPEVVRASPELHIAYEQKMKIIASSLANGLKADSQSESLSHAWALLGILIGGLTMARAVNSSESTEKIASSIIAAAIQAAGSTK